MAANLPTALHQRLRFDLAQGQIMDEDRRYLMMRTDVLMGMFNALAPEVRGQALMALAESVTQHGAGSVRAYAVRTGMDRERLLQAMVASAASLGWGAWQFQVLDAGLGLTVANSPFAVQANFGDMPACQAITGMLRAVGFALWGQPCVAVEKNCAHGGVGGPCVFELRPETGHPASGAGALP